MDREDLCRLADEVYAEPRTMTLDESRGVAQFVRDELDWREVTSLQDRIEELEHELIDLRNSADRQINVKVGDVELLIDTPWDPFLSLKNDDVRTSGKVIRRIDISITAPVTKFNLIAACDLAHDMDDDGLVEIAIPVTVEVSA